MSITRPKMLNFKLQTQILHIISADRDKSLRRIVNQQIEGSVMPGLKLDYRGQIDEIAFMAAEKSVRLQLLLQFAQGVVTPYISAPVCT